jgi:hypothetical protein
VFCRISNSFLKYYFKIHFLGKTRNSLKLGSPSPSINREFKYLILIDTHSREAEETIQIPHLRAMRLVAEWRSKPQIPHESTSSGPGERWWGND